MQCAVLSQNVFWVADNLQRSVHICLLDDCDDSDKWSRLLMDQGICHALPRVACCRAKVTHLAHNKQYQTKEGIDNQ